jgi:thiol-disulfide isomerase/thioredoxin
MVVLSALLLGTMLYLGVQEGRVAAPIEVGASAPPFRMPRYLGGSLSLDELRGKIVLLDFWATWCPPCAAEMPSLAKLAREYQDRDLVVVAASRDEGESAAAQVGTFIARRAPDLAANVVFADDPTASDYRVESLPLLYLIGRRGDILGAYSGYASEAVLRGRIEQALSK